MPDQNPLIAVVGVCASGKSTLANGLRSRGYNARQVLQEHSYVPYMWQAVTNPDVLIFLDCSIEATRKRRNKADFPDWILVEERIRLQHARENCHIYVDTELLSPDDVLRYVLERLSALPATH